MTQIWTVCRQLLELDIDVILDFGFPGRAQRDRFRQLAIEAGARPKIHVVAGDAAERRARVHARNRDRPATFALVVTDAMFDTSEGWWEPPNPEEL
jgi:predicted kinase